MAGQQERQPRKFSHAALAEATLTMRRAADVIQGRPLVRGITIDGPTSKDLDDALWLESNAQGGYWLHVSIADVGALITRHMTPALDKEAFARSFTRYYADRNVPMLPGQLSESRLSLLEGQLRPTITISIPLDAQLQAGEPAIQQTCISSSQRFSYDEVDAEIEHPRTEFAAMLQAAFYLAQGLLKARRATGALALYDLHSGWATTEEGTLIKLTAGERHKAQIIIQEAMILANRSFALYLAQRGIPALYRNHALKATAPERFALLDMLDAAVQHPERANPERVSATVDLAMERARYAATVKGHFGLNLPAYTHLTSPLRRYPDLINQHILHALLQGEPAPYSKAQLEQIAAHVNAQEDAVKDAKKAHFLGEHDQLIRRAVAEAEVQASTERPLAGLDAKQFHSAIRIAAETHELTPAFQQEIITRLEEHLLNSNDIFTLMFRFQNSGAHWDVVKQAALYCIQQRPSHAVSILIMGQQALEWSEARYTVRTEGPEHDRSFNASARVKVAGQHYASAPWSATQKDLARQFASVELIAKIVGLALPASIDTPLGEDDAQFTSLSAPESSLPATLAVSASSAQNYKGQLQELAQSQRWSMPVYTEGERAGPSHAPTFTVTTTLTVDGTVYTAQGIESTKAGAEQVAAMYLLARLPQPAIKTAKPSPATHKSAVSALNEMAQRQAINSVTYTYTSAGLPNHATFTCTCVLVTLDERQLIFSASGRSKKEATQEAASQALTALLAHNDGEDNAYGH